MKRAYYSNSIQQFLLETEVSILGHLTTHHSNRTLEELQINAWIKQIQILKTQLESFTGKVYFEFAIPRMGKRVDNIIIINDIVFVVEFKVGDGGYEKHAIEQVIDYTIDLKNFHEGSHHLSLVPLLVATNASITKEYPKNIYYYKDAAKSNQYSLADTIRNYVDVHNPLIDIEYWENSIYKPTPTIVEAARALYKNHNIDEISRSDSGAINLSKTSNSLNSIIELSKITKSKSICFVTGVPGAGKTLAGLNIAVQRKKTDENEHAVFLSGNGPLVDVLREALTRDKVLSAKENGEKLTKKAASIDANAFIQNIHHFRDDNLLSDKAPIEKVVVFDEAQRAWTNEQLSSFMKRKKGYENFNKSEPELLIDVMNRHSDWCTIVCLIGGGQEINTGEAGLGEWIQSLESHFSNWNIFYSNTILENNNYLKLDASRKWLKSNGVSKKDLHLAVSLRSFRSEKLSNFIHELLDIELARTQSLYSEIQELYPIVVTRCLKTAKKWLRNKAKGSERIGLISSSGARRLKPLGVDVKNEISAPYWFLNTKEDIRSSFFLEEVATEFDIQGLEIDYACVAWGGNFHMTENGWKYQNFKGTKWQNINKEIDKEYLKNTYRVLLTRARQGMVLFIPDGDKIDHTRPNEFYDETFNYLKQVGLKEI